MIKTYYEIIPVLQGSKGNLLPHGLQLHQVH